MFKENVHKSLGAWSQKHGLTVKPAWAEISPDRSLTDQVNTVSNGHSAQMSGQDSEDKSQASSVTDVPTDGGKELIETSNETTSQTPSTTDVPGDAGKGSNAATNAMSTPEDDHSGHQEENLTTTPIGNGSQELTQLDDPEGTPNSHLEHSSQTTDATIVTSSPPAGSSASVGGDTDPENAVISGSPNSATIVTSSPSAGSSTSVGGDTDPEKVVISSSPNSATIATSSPSPGSSTSVGGGADPENVVISSSPDSTTIVTSSPPAGSSTSVGGGTDPENVAISSSPDSTPPAARSLAISDTFNKSARVAGVKRRRAPVDEEGEVPSPDLSKRRRSTTQKAPSNGTYAKRLKAAGKRWEKMRAKALAPGAGKKADVISAMATRTLPYCRDYGSIPCQVTSEEADGFAVMLRNYGL